MIVFGTRSTRKLLGTGTFRCPRCAARTKYQRKRTKKWGRLFGVPLLPMETSAPYIECRRCKGTFVEHVLDRSRKAAQVRAEFERAAGLVMAKMVLADGKVEAAEKATLKSILERISGGAVEAEFIDALIAKARSDKRTAEDIAARFAGSLNANGAEQVVRASLMIALSDGELASSEEALLSGIAGALGVSEARYRSVVAEVMADPADCAGTLRG